MSVEELPRRHPELQALLSRARDQPAPEVQVRFEDVRAAARRRTWTRGWVAAAALAVGAVSLWAVTRPSPPPSHPAAAPRVAVAQPLEAEVPDPASVAVPSEVAAVLQVGVGATVEPLEGTEPPALRGTQVELGVGRYRVQTGAETLDLPLGARVLQIATASEVVVDTSLEHTAFEVRRGQAAWRADAPAPAASVAVEPTPKPRAGALLTEAESAMARGDRAGAIRLLRRLVRLHPSAVATKAGLIDLARLEKAAGRPQRAHCAYQVFIRRFASDARAPAVRRADDALAQPSVQCRGLSPR